MEDTIYRQAAIDTMCAACWDWCDEGVCKRVSALQQLPSAQPEIVHCKDCRHYKAYDYTGYLACHLVVGGTVRRDLDDFCSRAERRTEE